MSKASKWNTVRQDERKRIRNAVRQDEIKRILDFLPARRDTLEDEQLSMKTTSLVKSPTFSGSQEDWPFFKAELTAYLAKQTLELLRWKGTIPRDDFRFTGDA